MKRGKKYAAAALAGVCALSLTAGLVDFRGLRAAAAEPGQVLVQGFESATVGQTMTELKESGISLTDDAYIRTNDAGMEIVDGTTLGSGNALKLEVTRNMAGQLPEGENAYTIQVVSATPDAAAADADALAFRVKMPETENPGTLAFYLREQGGGEFYMFFEAYGYTIPFLLLDKDRTVYEEVNQDTPYFLPAGFDGWAVIPKTYFQYHTGYEGAGDGNHNLDFDKVGEVQMVLASAAVGTTYYFDELSFVNTDEFVGDAVCSDITGADMFVGLNFTTTNVGYDQQKLVDCGVNGTGGADFSKVTMEIVREPGFAGKTLKLATAQDLQGSYTFQTLNLAFAPEAAAADTFVLRIKTPEAEGPLNVAFQLFESDGEGWNYRTDFSAAPATVTLADVTTGTYSTAQLTGTGESSTFFLPGGFDGWVLLPRDYFQWHPAYPGANADMPEEERTLDFDKVNRTQIYFGNQPQGMTYYFDDLGAVADTADFLASIGSEPETPDVPSTVGQDFESAAVGDDMTALMDKGIMQEYNPDAYTTATIEIVDNDLGTGNAMKLTIAKDGEVTQVISVDPAAAAADDDALVFRIKTPDTAGTLDIHSREVWVNDKSDFFFPEQVTEVKHFKLLNADKTEYTEINTADFRFIPANFDGWVVIPNNYFGVHPGYADTNDDGVFQPEKIFRLELVFRGVKTGDTYYFDEFDFVKTDEFLGDAHNSADKEADMLVGQDFSGAEVGWDQAKLREEGIDLTEGGYIENGHYSKFEIVDSPLSDGNALEITLTDKVTANPPSTWTIPRLAVDFSGADASANNALVVRLKTPPTGQTLQTAFFLREGHDGEVYFSSETGYDTPVPVILADAATNTYKTVNLSASNFFLPANFDGWAVIPKEYFIPHPGYAVEGGNGTLDFDQVAEVWVSISNPTAGESYIFDSFGLTADTAAFLESIGSTEASGGEEPVEPAEKLYYVGQDFSGVPVGADDTTLVANGILGNFEGYVTLKHLGYEVKDNGLGCGNSLQFTGIQDVPHTMLPISLDFGDTDITDATHLVLRIKTPEQADATPTANIELMLHEENHELFQGNPDYSNNPVELTYVDAETNEYTTERYTGTKYILPWDFDGWVMVPLEFFSLHPAYMQEDGNGELDLDQIQDFILLIVNPLDAVYEIDEIGFTNNVSKLVEDMGCTAAAADIYYDMVMGSIETVPASDFESIQGTDKTLNITVTDEDGYERYIWTFNGMDITEPADFNPEVFFDSTDADAIEALAGSRTPFYIRYAEEGALPGTASLMVYVGEYYELYTDLEFCQYDEAGNAIEVVETDFAVNGDGFVEIPMITRTNGFMLDVLSGEDPGTGDGDDNIGDGDGDIEDITGTGVAAPAGAAIAALAALAVVAIVVTRKKKAE